MTLITKIEHVNYILKSNIWKSIKKINSQIDLLANISIVMNIKMSFLNIQMSLFLDVPIV